MTPESDELTDYLACDAVIDWQNPLLLQKVAELTEGVTDEVDKARLLYEWVRDAISHSNDAGIERVTCVASDVLLHGTGICFAKSHLLAALLRGAGIPCGFCYQVLRSDPPYDNEPVLHGLNALYLASLGRWIRVDARGNSGGINARFSVTKEQLAFAMDADADEFIYDTIFADPVSSVVERLQMYESRSELWQDLPQSL